MAGAGGAQKSLVQNWFSGAPEIDRTFGPGYAKEHPELVGAIMISLAIDFAVLGAIETAHELAAQAGPPLLRRGLTLR